MPFHNFQISYLSYEGASICMICAAVKLLKENTETKNFAFLFGDV